ncbi:MltR family transcriptional regulator [Dongia sedimenti]|uniref:MltR family transcriptional regulator n=1 Tax=Dongia sedimenti TaxID=3064282 RepID=A0ABU0YUL2_9PROT|nr:MltR family transcriptional regulator [Rhodospirillaceae bacterium R-7]
MVFMLMGAHGEIGAADDIWTLEDRAAAIVAAALLDGALDRAVQAAFVQDPEALKSMFAESSPLGSFGNRINLGYLLGIYSKDARDDLRRIAKVRNRFAHSLAARKFTDDGIRDHCMNLKLVERYMIDANDPNRKLEPGDFMSYGVADSAERLKEPRSRYTETVALLHKGLQAVGGGVPVPGTPKF